MEQEDTRETDLLIPADIPDTDVISSNLRNHIFSLCKPCYNR